MNLQREIIPNGPSGGLQKLLEEIGPFEMSADFGCGLGRNLPLLFKKSKHIFAYDINLEVIKSVKTKFPGVRAETISLSDIDFYDSFDLGVAWRVLHLDRRMIDNVVNSMKHNSYLAIALSSRNCEYYHNPQLYGGTEICDGTIQRTDSQGNLEQRHYYTHDEIVNLDTRLKMLKHEIVIEPRCAGKGFKQYHSVLYQVKKS